MDWDYGERTNSFNGSQRAKRSLWKSGAMVQWPSSITAFAALGVVARELRVPEVSTREIRARLNLSQSDFALRFGFELDTVHDWDQGRNQLDAATKLLLAIIDRDPAIVDAVLSDLPLKSV